MAKYEEHTWVDGELITTIRMNHLEEGMKSIAENMTDRENVQSDIRQYVDEGLAGATANTIKVVSYDTDQTDEFDNDDRALARNNIAAVHINSIATPYDSTQTYSVGNICNYNGKIYKCISDVTANTEWNAENWTEDVLSNYMVTMTGATSSVSGATGFVPAPASGDENKHLTGAGTWEAPVVRNGEGTAAAVEGQNTEAAGDYSHAAGIGTVANTKGQMVFGSYNIGDSITLTPDITFDIDTTNPVIYWNARSVMGDLPQPEWSKFIELDINGILATDVIEITSINPAFSGDIYIECQEDKIQINTNETQDFTITGKVYHLGTGAGFTVAGNATNYTPTIPSSSYAGSYIEIVGNGSNNSHRNNARTLDWSGNEVIAGQMTATQFNGSAAGLTGIPSSSLPLATTSDVGGIKIGNGLSIAAETGILSVTNGLPTISAADNYKQMMVVDGQWELVTLYESATGHYF